jgi:hypothetical protein
MPIAIGSDLQLLWGDFITNVGASSGYTRRLTEPQRLGQVITFDQPWEGCYSDYASLLYDPAYNAARPYRLWYRAAAPNPATPLLDGANYTCYAESADCRTWVRPNLGLVTFAGNANNNICRAHDAVDNTTHNFQVFKDLKPAVPGAELYKATGGTGGVLTFISPDGIHWTQLALTSVVTDTVRFDTFFSCFYDTKSGLYRLYYRDLKSGLRWIKAADSPDFRTWTTRGLITTPNGADQEYYQPSIAPYPGAPHYLIGLPKRWINRSSPFSTIPVAGYPGTLLGSGASDGLFMFNDLRDTNPGTAFDRRFDDPWCRPGPEFENQGPESNGPSQNLVPLPEGGYGVINMVNSSMPDAGLELLQVGRDRVACLHAPWTAVGTLANWVSQNLTFTGDRLLVNFRTGAAGQVSIALQNNVGVDIAGRGLANTLDTLGDYEDFIYTWAGGAQDLSAWVGVETRLFLQLHDCDVYSLRFGNYRTRTVAVTDGTSPLVGAEVRIQDAAGLVVAKKTRYDGAATFALLPGTYSYTVSAAGKVTGTGTFTASTADATTTVALGAAPAGTPPATLGQISGMLGRGR